jgi:predicted metal-dependent enzyme (double-stranded beta helix superfamily)
MVMKTLPTNANLPDLIAPIARAVHDDRVTSLAGVLAQLCEQGAFTPELFLPAQADHYSRKLIWHDPDDRFVVVGMTWAPRQGSALHDHAGLWGAEIVIDGVMNETMFALVERGADGRFRFERGMHRVSGRGTVGVLIPPLEYHDFGNGGRDRCALVARVRRRFEERTILRGGC